MKKHTEERLAAIVESSFDAIISKDLAGTIVSWNRAAEQMFGYREQEAVGQSIYLLVPGDKHDEEARILEQLKLGERIETFETARRHRDGRQIPVSITISPIKSRAGKLVGSSSIARDISQTKENERRLHLLMREVNHRVKNQYAVVLAVVRQTAMRAGSVKEFEARIRERIMALSHSHDLLSQVDWAGVSLAQLVSHQLKTFEISRTVKVSGPDITLDANAVLNIGMALHELAINAIRFGAIESQHPSVTWSILPATDGNGQRFELKWSELAVEYAELLMREDGFGALVLRKLVPSALSGQAAWSMHGGFIQWTLIAPLSAVQVTPP